MYKFPIRIPDDWRLYLAQPFRAETTIPISSAYSTSPAFHDGVDVVCGTPEQTWGSACVWPFPFPGVVYDAEVDSPMGATQHAHSQIDGVDPATGIQYSLIYLHVSAVAQTKSPVENKQIVYKQGDVIGWIGNNGAVNFVLNGITYTGPIVSYPFGGSHLHLGVGVKKPGELNATMVDPLLYFDLNNPFRGPDDPSRDKPVYDWVIAHGGIPSTPNVPSFKFNQNLWVGLKNDDIVQLQKRLRVTPLSGYFGVLTLAAVIRYQRANAIPPTGFVGPLTRAKLNSTV